MKSLKDVLGNGDFAKRMLKKRFPNLAEKDFEVKEDPKECKECEQPNLVRYLVKIEGQDEWRTVPEKDNEICIKCEDKRMARQAYERHKQIKFKYLWVLTRELENATLTNFTPRCLHTTQALEIAEKFVTDFLNGDKHNLFWVGSYGTGKSHLSKAIAERLNHEGFTVAFISVDELLTMIKNTFDDKTRSEKQILDDLKAVDLLVLDELGTDDQKTSWAKGTINEIVNSRNGKTTIYTTNLTMDDLEMVLDGRTVDRLHQNTKVVELYTQSFRRQQTR